MNSIGRSIYRIEHRLFSHASHHGWTNPLPSDFRHKIWEKPDLIFVVNPTVIGRVNKKIFFVRKIAEKIFLVDFLHLENLHSLFGGGEVNPDVTFKTTTGEGSEV